MDRDGGNLMRDALAACRPHFLYVGGFSGLINLLYLAPSIYMLQVYDRVVTTGGTATLLLITFVLAFALVCLSLLDAIRMRLLQRASMRLERIAADGLLSRVLGGHLGQSQRSNAMRDFDTLRGVLTGPALVALFDAPWIPIYIIVCFLLHPWIGVLAMLSSVMLLLVAWRGERAAAVPLKRAGEQAAQAYQLQDFSIRAAEIVRALGMRRSMVQRHMRQRREMVRLQGQVANTSGGYLAASKLLRLLLGSLGLGLGALLAIRGDISAGAIFAASLIIGRALQPLEQILGALRNSVQARNAYRNLVTLCDAEDVGCARTALPRPRGDISVEQVAVRNTANDGTIIRDIAFAAVPGEIVALVGPSGSGKSTLLRVLSGGLVPSEGAVRIDGASYGDWDGDVLGRHIGYVPQDATLFPGTVSGNIGRFGGPVGPASADMDEMVVRAAQAAGAHEMILRLSNGYETLLGPGGIGLSAGQQQRVAMARALFGEPAVVLLDEPNAHLDGEGDARLLQTLRDLKARDATVIVSAHRTGILEVADKILVLRDGAIQVFAPADQVLRRPDPKLKSAPAGPAQGANTTKDAA